MVLSCRIFSKSISLTFVNPGMFINFISRGVFVLMTFVWFILFVFLLLPLKNPFTSFPRLMNHPSSPLSLFNFSCSLRAFTSSLCFIVKSGIIIACLYASFVVFLMFLAFFMIYHLACTVFNLISKGLGFLYSGLLSLGFSRHTTSAMSASGTPISLLISISLLTPIS